MLCINIRMREYILSKYNTSPPDLFIETVLCLSQV